MDLTKLQKKKETKSTRTRSTVIKPKQVRKKKPVVAPVQQVETVVLPPEPYGISPIFTLRVVALEAAVQDLQKKLSVYDIINRKDYDNLRNTELRTIHRLRGLTLASGGAEPALRQKLRLVDEFELLQLKLPRLQSINNLKKVLKEYKNSRN